MAVLSSVTWLALTAAGGAQTPGGPGAGLQTRSAGPAASVTPAALNDIGFDQNIGWRLPLDTSFRDETGRVVRIGDYFGARPIVLVFAYYDCPMLCDLVANGLAGALHVLSLQPGRDYEVVTVSFNPRDTPAAAATKKAAALERLKKPGADAAWHFLTGEQPSIDALTRAAGFRYAWDAPTKQYAHPTGVIVLTPDGRIARYLFGIEFGPRDLRLGLVDASAGKVGTVVDQVLLYCFHYDPATGRYGFAIVQTLRAAGAATVLALGGFIFVMVRRERRRDGRPLAAVRHPPARGR